MANQILLPVALALCAFATPALAQTAPPTPPPSRESEAGIPLLRNYTTRDYGFTQTFTAAAQSRNGIMYFAAGGVLMEYDGVTWRSTPIPGSNAVRAVAIDTSDRIWVGAGGDFGYLQSAANGTWQFISLLDKVPPRYRSFNFISQVVSTPQGTYFQAAERIFRWDGNQMKVWPASSQFLSLASIQGHIYTSQAGIGLQEIVGDEVKSLPGDDAWKAPFALSVLPYDDHRILIAAQNKLALYDGAKAADFPTAADDYLKAKLLARATALPDGAFCLNTRRGGAVIIEHDGRLRRIIDQAAGLQGPSVLNAFTDREGALWLTLRGNVTRIEVNSPISVISRNEALDVARYDGSLYVSSTLGSLFRLVPNRETALPTLQPIPTPPTLLGARLLAFQDATGKAQLLWGTTLGLMKIEGDLVSPALAGQPTYNQPVNMLPSRKFPDRIYLAQGRGVWSVRWEGGKWRDEGRLPDLPGSASTWAEESDGTLWAGTQAGAVRIEPASSGLMDAKSTLYSSKDGLGNGGVDAVSVAGQIFISTSSQDIRRWDKTTEKFVPDKRFFLPLKNSLFDAMRELPNGDIWAANRSANEQRFGLHRRQPDGTFILDEASFQRLAWSSIRQVRSDPDGVLWFPTNDGLFRFDQRVKSATRQTFSTLVRRVGSGADDIIFGGSTVPGAAAVRLPYDRNSLQFAFAAPVFGNETATLYRYRLEGGEANWSPWAKSTQANYSSLAPGDYRFRVQARDISGRLGEEGIYAFAIIPPWYRTWFAYSGYGLLFVLLIFAGRRRVITRERESARQQTETLEHTVAERTKEIRLQAGEISERAAELATVNRISQALSGQLDMDRLIQLVGDQIREVFHASIAYVALLDRQTMMLHFPYTYGEEVAPRLFGEGLTSQIIRSGQALLINEDFEGSSRKLGVSGIGRLAASYLGVPIPAGGEMIGVLSVQSAEEEGRFTEADQKLLATIAASVGVAVHNARLFEEAKQARAAAEQADEAKSTFLSTVSHELRTPLTSVLGFAKIIRKRLDERLFPLIPEDDKKVAAAKRQVTENLNVVVSEGERLTKLINDVLDLAKINAGKFTWNLGEVSMAEVIDRALAATSSLLETKKLDLVCQVDNDLPLITGDSDRLMQVVINLISNAVKFTESGTITCTATVRDSELIVSVQDSGIGIRPEDQPRVFEKFKQVGDTLTDKPQGSGLGLPISKEIVEFHGGRIWVESEINKGSTFFFSLPVKANPAGPASLLAPHSSVSRSMDFEALVRQLKDNVAGHQPRPKSVLVVDDDANIRSVLQQEFTEAGYPVRLAENGRQALAMIREETPGLVILDVMMPEMNGFDVAAVLKNDPATMDIPIIILSIVEDKERGFRLGVDRYLTKPIDTESLLREVGTLLDQGKSKKKVMVVDEDASTLRTLTEVLETRGYHVMEATGTELFSKAVAARPDIIVLSSLLSGTDSVRSLRFEKGLENVLFLIYK